MSLEPVVTQQWNIRVQDEVGMMTLYKKEPEEFGVGSMRQREVVPQDCLKSPPPSGSFCSVLGYPVQLQ